MKKLFSVCCLFIFMCCFGINIKTITKQDFKSSNLTLIGIKLAMANDEGGGGNGYKCTIEACSKVIGGTTYQGHYRHCAIDLPEYSCVPVDCYIECDAGI